jgi:hypothetical protein
VLHEHFCNYTPDNLITARLLLSRPVTWLAYRLRPDAREVLSVECVRRGQAE